MNRAHTIRPAFIRDYHVRNRAYWDERLDNVKCAEEARRALNADFGVERSASYHGQPDPAYDRRYRAITAEFRPQYDAIGEREKGWLKASDMTIPEFLFVDNFSTELAELCQRPDFEALHYFSFIEAKAQMLLTRWKPEFTYAGMGRRVQMEIDDFHYARKRCWKHFGFRPWDIDAWRQARLYRKIYARTLRERLDRSTVA